MTLRFAIGFLPGLLIFLAISLISAHFSSDCGLPAVLGHDSCSDDIARAGWPLIFYEEGGFDYRYSFNPPALMLDLGIGMLLACRLGWLSSQQKINPA